MTALGRDRMILGYPFLQEFNLQINWTNRKLEGGNVTLQSTKFKYLRQVFRRVGETLRKTGQLPEQIIAFLRHTNLAQEWNHLEEMNHTHITMETIPKEFRRHWKVFSEELSKWFPPKCNPDMTIKFLPNAPSSIKCKPYLRSKAEGEIKEGWIKQEKALGCIEEGASQHVSPIFFIGKKDSGKKRVIINYRRVNAWTIRDHNPMPGIQAAMEHLQGKMLFLKFDIWHSYNNIQLAEEDRHKAAIQTHYGTYISKSCTLGCAMHPHSSKEQCEKTLHLFLNSIERMQTSIWMIGGQRPAMTKQGKHYMCKPSTTSSIHARSTPTS
jgi:hypothetical protein